MPYTFNPFTSNFDYYRDGSIGGNITGGTDGSVLFIHPSGILAQDNANFFWNSTNAYLGLGTNSPSTRNHVLAPSATIADPSGLNMSLSVESSLGAPTDSPSFFYGAVDTNSGSGTENSGYNGYTNNDSVQATVYSYIIDPRDGTSRLTSPNGFDLGTVNLGNNPSGIDWSWNTANRGDGSGVDGYVIVINDSTISTSNSFDVGNTTSYADNNVTGSFSYGSFSGITSSGQTFNFEPYNVALSPSGGGYYASGSGGDFGLNEGYNNGSQFWVVHSLSGTGYAKVFLLDTVAGASVETSSNTYYQTAPLSGTGSIPYSQHYGLLSDGSVLNLTYNAYSEATSPSTYFSSGYSTANTSDPNDGQYYVVSVSISSIGGGTTTRILRQDGYYMDTSTYPFTVDTFGPNFSIGNNVSPSSLSNTAIIAQNSSASYSQASAIQVVATAPTIMFTNSFNGTEYIKMGYDPAAAMSFIKNSSGNLQIRNSSNGIITQLYSSSTKFNALRSSSYDFLIPTSSYDPFFQIDSNGNYVGIGPGSFNTSAWINLGAGTSSKAQLNFATQSSFPSVSSGGMMFDGSHLFLDNSSFRAYLLQTGTGTILTNNSYPIANSSGNLIDGRISTSGGITTVQDQILAQNGISLSSNKDIAFGTGSKISGGFRTGYATAAVSTSLNIANHSPIFVFTGSTAGRTLTLPTAASISGTVFEISNEASVSVTVATTSSQNLLFDNTTATSIILQPGDRYKFIATASSTWDVANIYRTTVPVANGGTNVNSASITAFNNITGYTAAGATGTTSTNLVFSTSPTLVTPVLGAATYTTLSGGNVTNSALTATRLTFAGTAGLLSDDADLTFTGGDTLNATKIISSSLTASQIAATDGSKQIVSLATATYPSLTELSYVKGVTSAIQTQINALSNPWTLSSTNLYAPITDTVTVGTTSTTKDVFTVNANGVLGNGAWIDYTPSGIGGIDTYTKLMLHLDSNLTDSSTAQTAKTVTNVGSATFDTTNFKFGTASVSLDGSSQYLTTPDSADFQVGSGDFTVDFWVWYIALPSSGNTGRFFRWVDGGGNNGLFINLINTAGVYSIRSDALGSGSNVGDSGNVTITTPTLNTWYHYAWVRNGSTWKFYINGTAISTITDSAAVGAAGATFSIGANAAGTQFLNVKFDEFRFSKGIARWTTTFTPPVSAYTSASAFPRLVLSGSGTQTAKVWTDGANSDRLTTTVATTDIAYATTTDQTFNTNVKLSTAGNGFYIKEGTNATMGTGTLVGGTLVVSTTKVTANSRIFLTDTGGTVTNLGTIYLSARSAGTSFTVNSSNILDVSTFNWLLIEPS